MMFCAACCRLRKNPEDSRMMVVPARMALRTTLIASVVITALSVAAAISGHGVAHAADAAPVHYTLDPAKSTFEYQFTQAGALNKGKFTKYTVTLDFSADTLATSK